MLINKNNNQSKFVQMDKIYLNNFSYKLIQEKVNELQKYFNNQEILDYFLIRSQVQSFDYSIMKYIFPIFLLPDDMIKENANKIVKNFQIELLNFIVQYIKEDKMKLLLQNYIVNCIQNYNNENFLEINEFLSDLKGFNYYFAKNQNELVKLYEVVIKSNYVQKSFISLIKMLSAKLPNIHQTESNTLVSLFSLLSIDSISFVKEEVSNIILSPLPESFKHTKNFIIKSIVKNNLLSNELIESLIKQINHHKKNNTTEIVLSLLYKEIIKDDFLEIINTEHLIKLAKHSSLEVWKNILMMFDSKGIDIEYHKEQFIKKITNDIIKNFNLDIFIDNNYLDFYMNVIIKNQEKYYGHINMLIDYLTKHNYKYNANIEIPVYGLICEEISIESFKQKTWKHSKFYRKEERKNYKLRKLINMLIMLLFQINDSLIGDLKIKLFNDIKNNYMLESIEIYTKFSNKYEKIASQKINKILEGNRLYKDNIEYIQLLTKYLTIDNNEDLLNKLYSLNNLSITNEVNKRIAEEVSRHI